MTEIKDHRRINDTLLGPFERPALKWLAAHQPAWVTPDLLTAIGTLGAVVIFAGFVLSNYDKKYLWLATLGFIINWYGDSLDGTLARYRHIERPRYGYFVDHTVDSFNEVLVFVGLGLSPYLRFDIASLLLTSYLLMSILVFVQTAVSGIFQLSYVRLGPTELRVIAVLANTGVYFFGNPIIQLPFTSLSVYDLVAATLAFLLFVVFIVSTLREARRLAQEEKQIPSRTATATRIGRRGKTSRRSKGSLTVDNPK